MLVGSYFHSCLFYLRIDIKKKKKLKVGYINCLVYIFTNKLISGCLVVHLIYYVRCLNNRVKVGTLLRVNFK